MSFAQIDKTLKKEKPTLKKEFFVKTIAVFGSFASGKNTPQSDVDILVEFEKPIGLDFIGLKSYLEKKLKRDVDLVTPRALKPLIKKQILSEAQFI